MREPNDWRIGKHVLRFKEAAVTWAEVPAPSGDWDHDHCVFCWDKFMQGQADTLTEGYVTTDGQHWICKPCFEDLKQEFGFKVVS